MRNLLLFIVAGCTFAACQQKQEPAAEAKPGPIEFADSTYINPCKAGLMALASGDVDAFGANMADNAVFQWNAGDSIAGKPAIIEYWKDRRGNVIDKLEVSNDIWLAVKVNQSKQVSTGVYVFGWARVTASYKGGKSMTQWIHNIYHFDANGKIDRTTQFLDRAPIAAAMPAKK